MQNFSAWLHAWKNLTELPAESKDSIKIPVKGGTLSKETHFALTHTTDAILALTQYVFETFKLKYLLLGKFQTDNLEARFGQYRQMSGANYCIAFKL